jgi:ATP-dependent DNA ligase
MRTTVTSLTDSTKTYQVDIIKNTCECKSWKYQRKPIHARTCKHLDSLRPAPLVDDTYSLLKYPVTKVKDDYFQLISSHVPRRKMDDAITMFTFSTKYDGIRIRLRDGMATTRGGMTIDLKSMKLPFGMEGDELEYDCELIHRTKPGHRNVMTELDKNHLKNLDVRAFDLIDSQLTFQDRYRLLTSRLLDTRFRVTQFPIKNWNHLMKELRSVLAKGEEGLVIRNGRSKYTRSHRSVKNAFKLKRIPDSHDDTKHNFK